MQKVLPLTKYDFITDLPVELALHILSFVDHKTIAQCARVSKVWYLATIDPSLWQRLFYAQGWSLNRQKAHRLHDAEPVTLPFQRRGSSTSLLLETNVLDRRRVSFGHLVHQDATTITSQTLLALRPQSDTSLSALSDQASTVFSSPTSPLPDSEPALDKPKQEGPRLIDWKRMYAMRLHLERNWHTLSYTKSTLKGHQDGIYCLQFDSTMIVTGSRDQSIKLWDRTSGACTKTLAGHTSSVLCLHMDASHNTIVSGSSSAELFVWDVTTGSIYRRLTGHADSVLCIQCDDRHLISCSKDKTLRVFNRQRDWEPVAVLYGHKASVNAVQMSRDYIVSGSGDRTIKIWHRNTFALHRTLEGHERGVASISFDGRTIYSGSNDRTIKLWDVVSGQCLQSLEGHTDLVRGLQVGLNRLVSASYDQTIRFWDPHQAYKEVALFRHEGNAKLLHVQFDATTMMACSQDQVPLLFFYNIKRKTD